MVESQEWITQTRAAELKDMTLKAINALVLRKRIRSKEVYGKTLVSRADVLAYEPLARNKWSKKRAKTKKSHNK
jgi:predicted HTH domain antitoxin